MPEYHIKGQKKDRTGGDIMNLPRIIDCSMSDCTYNTNNMCHALAITGGAAAPMCDTFLKLVGKKGGVMGSVGGVGACKVESCKFNNSFECIADGIHVGRHADHAECDTFAPR
jgi:hypothetical protein